MRIAQIAPLYESVPPKLYGGTERVVAHLCNGLVEAGHEVTLFACAESKTLADLYVCRDKSIRLDPDPSWDTPAHLSMLAEVRDHVNDFDIIHFHSGITHFPLFDDICYKTVTTFHGRQDIKDLPKFYSRYQHCPLVAISNSQREMVPDMNWIKTVYHGYPLDQYQFTEIPKGNYLAFLGRISPEKGVVEAINIAEKVGLPLRVAAKTSVDIDYYEEQVKPLLDNNHDVKFIGEIKEEQKSDFLGNAVATLFPATAAEAFGLVMIESFACGTPVVGFKMGSVPEVINEGITGFSVDNVDQAVFAVKKSLSLDRKRIRRKFECRFSLDKMINGYEEVYNKLLGI